MAQRKTNKPTIAQPDGIFKFDTTGGLEQEMEKTEQSVGAETAHSTSQEVQEKPKTNQISIYFSDEEINWLDDHCESVRRRGWRGLRRSALVRAIVEALKDKHIDLTGVSTEEELVAALRRAL